MKKIFSIVAKGVLAACLLPIPAACSDFLEVTPENSQVADDYWKTEADVENMLFGGYYDLRATVEPFLIPWGEVRLGMVYNARSTTKLQSWQMTSSQSLCNWSSFYQIINIANTVLERASEAQAADDTYSEASMRSHYCEAYFLRALSYFYLVRNFRDVPMPLKAYADDNVEINLAKSDEATVIAQIKADLRNALATGAAKESFPTTWETKGRATKWAIYALMADVCLWSEDYEGCIQYCNMVLNAKGAKTPAFMATPTRSNFMSMFNPGNSNESIFEIQYNYEEEQTNTLPILFDDINVENTYAVSPDACTDFVNEFTSIAGDDEVSLTGRESARTYHSSFYPGAGAGMSYGLSKGYVWKYLGSTTEDKKRTSTYYDPNFIIYRVADVMLMKAEAAFRLLEEMPEDIQRMEQQVNAWIADNSYEEWDDDLGDVVTVTDPMPADIQALKDAVSAWSEKNNTYKLMGISLINRIRERAGYTAADNVAGSVYKLSDPSEAYAILETKSQQELLEMVLNERKMEFLGEGKIWYDVLRMGRANNNQFKQDFLVEQVVKYNTSASESWLRSVLNSDNALFLPILASEIERNANLVQNPYYN